MGKYYPKTIDAHVHAFGHGIQGLQDMLAFEKKLGYTACNFLSCECMGDAAQNALGIYLKLTAPENYAFGGLTYRYSYDYAKEAQTLWEIGFDGMKMVEDKPTLRKQIGVPFNDPAYDRYYAWLETNGIPLLAHVADPEEFWDKDLIPDWAVANGYFYGNGEYVSKETLYAEVDDVLKRFPKLHVTFAHFYFMSGDLERLDALLEKHSNVNLDIVAGTEMYFNFAKRPDDWRKFFIKYQDRIIFGTDNSNLYDKTEIENSCITNRLENEFLASDGDIPAWDKTAKGIGLPLEVQEKILRTNFLHFVHGDPRPLNVPAACRYLEKRLENEKLAVTDEERAVIVDVLESMHSSEKAH
jgi:predicted TIM-barrel fold metal-dependent hydrolase